MWEKYYTALVTIERNEDGTFKRENGQKKVVFLEKWNDATKKTDEQINKHFENKNAALAMLTGKKNGLTIIDFDTKDDELIMELYLIAPTKVIETEKGFHFYYKYISDKDFYTKAGAFGEGVDCRNDGGVIFCPPTPNYKPWSKEPTSDISEYGLELLKTKLQGKKKIDLANSTTRNDDLFRMACGWIDHYDEKVVWSRMVKANRDFKKGSLDDKELDAIYQQAVKYKKTGELPKADENIKIVHLSELAELQGEEALTKTGMGFLDESMGGGVAKGSAIVVAAVAGEGKTTFMQSLSYHVAKQGMTCLWFSYEERVSAIWNRFKNMGLNKKHILLAPTDLSDNKIDYISRVVDKQKETEEFFFVFIDQLSHIAPKVDKNTNINSLSSNFALYLGEMSKQLKEMAMEKNIIVVVAHQLGRSGELAYSDMIRHAPDKVIFLEREPAPKGGTEKFTDKTFMKMNKNRPIGTSPIIPMRVINNRFVHYDSNGLAEDAIEIMGARLDL